MKVVVLVKASRGSEAGEMPSEQLMADMGRFNEELVKAGIMRMGEGLKPTSVGKRVLFSGKSRTVTDGPFAETKELVAGFWLWDVKSMEEAVEWVKRCPNPMMEDSEIEIRPVFECDDFAECDPTGEWRAHEDGLRRDIAMQHSQVRPYLFFGGRCEEALEFYKEALGAKVGMVLRFDEAPDPVPDGMLQPGFEHKIMHAEFTAANLTIMASDGCDDKSRFGGFRLALTIPCKDEAERAFKALAQEGRIDMPLARTFFSPLFGQVTDKFGVGWMVMVPGDQ